MLSKKLSELLQGLFVKKIEGDAEAEITGIAYDSRQVRPGYLFCCLQGIKHDGHVFAPQAVARGARAVLAEKDIALTGGTKILVPRVRWVLPYVAANFYDHPGERLSLIGVTGTNGKTTTTHLIERLLRASGEKTGLIGTICYQVAGETKPVLATTPESSDLQRLLHEMVQSQVQTAIIEVSSHALAQDRVAGCNFEAAVLTNITGDHLDYHRTFADYRAAKGKLFAVLGGSLFKQARPKVAVINRDDPHFEYIAEQSAVQRLTYGLDKKADLYASQVTVSPEGSSFQLESPWGKENFSLQLAGLFNVYNSLAAIAVGLTRNLDLPQIKSVLEGVRGIPGRFERVDCGQDFLVIVDYAHTPDGLQNLLTATKEIAQGRIITVFGCGGDRDRSKRPQMGQVAVSYSDYAILTSDNPRSEEPAAIAREVEEGMAGAKGEGYAVILEREEAIREAIFKARRQDIVVIAGKGHEEYQIFRERTIPFSDREVARKILQERLAHGTMDSTDFN